MRSQVWAPDLTSDRLPKLVNEASGFVGVSFRFLSGVEIESFSVFWDIDVEFAVLEIHFDGVADKEWRWSVDDSGFIFGSRRRRVFVRGDSDEVWSGRDAGAGFSGVEGTVADDRGTSGSGMLFGGVGDKFDLTEDDRLSGEVCRTGQIGERNFSGTASD